MCVVDLYRAAEESEVVWLEKDGYGYDDVVEEGEEKGSGLTSARSMSRLST
jgi:hypothetical protein